MHMENDVILEVEGIRKEFPGVLALDNVHFKLKRGEIHAIVGENGAGKSTLMHILGGIYEPDSGNIYIDNKKVKFNNPVEANKAGVSIVFQDLSLVRELSIAENIFANRQPVNKINLIKFNSMYEEAKKMLNAFNENINPKIPVKFLSIDKMQVVEILKAMSNNPKILILDEPTSSLSKSETERLFANIKSLKQKGISIIYISHHLQEIFDIADRATVLKDGKYVDTVEVSKVDEKKLVSLMVGREVSHKYIKREKVDKRSVLFRVEKLNHDKLFKDISFVLHPGEIIGFAGLVGSGRTELAKSIFGLFKIQSGKIYLEGQEVRINSPVEAMEKGIVYTSEDRKEEGLFPTMDVRSNCIVTQLKKFAQRKGLGLLNEKKISSYSEELVRKFHVNTPSIRQTLRNLSGGNQQKVLLSMWLGINPKVVIVDEPTKGIDVGAKSEIYDILRQLADTGVGIIVISSELLGILAISDRIFVMREGKIVASLNNDEANERNVVEYATGVEK